MKFAWLLLAAASLAAAAVEDDFDEDEITVADDNEERPDEVTIEKVAVDVKYLSPDDNVYKKSGEIAQR